MTSQVAIAVGGANLSVRALRGRECLGEASRFEVTALSPTPIAPDDLLMKPCALRFESQLGARDVHGVVVSVERAITSQKGAARLVVLTIASELELFSFRRSSRVYQHLTPQAIITKVLVDGGYPSDRIALEIAEEHPARDHVVQYQESDSSFVRRIAEEHGLFFRFDPHDDGYDVMVIADTSSAAPSAGSEARVLPIVDASALEGARPAAFHLTSRRQRRPGKVAIQDYDPQHPALDLTATCQTGIEVERSFEVFRAPGRFESPATGAARARAMLEALRADAETVRFRTTDVEIAPGRSFGLEVAEDYTGVGRPAGLHFATSIEHDIDLESGRFEQWVTAIPSAIVFRLRETTHKPRCWGVQSAFVTGARGEEIHVDDAGRARVRFHWDRHQPNDDTSSLPIRVMQPHMPGSMLLPRVGWEAIVAFEDGDPDRPLLLGRAYSEKWRPPHALPANKTMTALGTLSSPGGKCGNTVHIDDAAGRQHMVWSAGFGKTTTVAGNMNTQVAGFAQTMVVGAQSRSVGGSQTVGVKSALIVDVASQTAVVGGSQDLTMNGNKMTKVGPETVSVGGSLNEIVGDPKSGVGEFVKGLAIQGFAQIPVVGKAIAAGIAIDQAYQKGGTKAALEAAAREGVSDLLHDLPGHEALMAAAENAGIAPWAPPPEPPPEGAQEGGGGTGGDGASGPTGPTAGPGHRKLIVNGSIKELVGAACIVTSPGPIKWTSVGAVTIAVAGTHSTAAAKVSNLTAGISADTSSAVSITTTGQIGRNVLGMMKTTAGSLSSSAVGKHHIKVGATYSIQVGGSMTLTGGKVVFNVGGSTMAAHSGGLLLKAPKIKVNGKSVQSSKATNAG